MTAIEQPTLFDSAAMPDGFFVESENSHEFTAARLFKARPEAVRQIVQLTAEGIGAHRIANILSVSVHTVLAVREARGEEVATEKNRVSLKARNTGRLCVERIAEIVADRSSAVSAKDLAVIAGILLDKAELLSGGATARIESKSVIGHADVQEYMDAILMGSGGGNEGAKGGARREAGAPGDGREWDPAALGGARTRGNTAAGSGPDVGVLVEAEVVCDVTAQSEIATSTSDCDYAI